MKQKELNFKIYIIFAIFMFILVISVYIWNFNEYKISKEVGDWGTFGDFIGGTLNPILAFLSFLALLRTIKIQSKELKASREELELTRSELARSADAQKEQSNSIKIQNFENTFFNMLNLHNEIIKNIQIKKDSKFTYFSSSKKDFNIVHFTGKFDENDIFGRTAIKKIVESIDSISKEQPPRLFHKIYDLCHDSAQTHIGHYFGNIYQILQFISKDTTISDKKKYANLFRAQFSSTELKLLFYHSAGKIGSEKLKKYIEEFNFFEHLVIEKDNNNFRFIISGSIFSDNAFGSKKDKFEHLKNDIIDENRDYLDNKIGKEIYKISIIQKCYETRNYTLAKKYLEELEEYVHQGNIEVIIQEIEDEITKLQEQQ